jgi:hypothetical protein
MEMTRKEFLTWSVALAGTALVGCSSDDSGAATGSGCNNPTATIGSNHGHVMVVDKADVDAAADKTYDIKGQSGHTHSVTLSASDFGKLKAGAAVQVVSSNGDGHTHTVSVVCA